MEEIEKLRKKYQFHVRLMRIMTVILFLSLVSIFTLFYLNYSSHDGLYFRFLKISVVKLDNDFGLDENIRLFTHEYGHHVYFYILNESDKNRWKEISQKSEGYVSFYASSSNEEDFAESFSYSVSCYYYPELISLIDKNKSNFLREIYKKYNLGENYE